MIDFNFRRGKFRFQRRVRARIKLSAAFSDIFFPFRRICCWREISEASHRSKPATSSTCYCCRCNQQCRYFLYMYVLCAMSSGLSKAESEKYVGRRLSILWLHTHNTHAILKFCVNRKQPKALTHLLTWISISNSAGCCLL